MEARVWIEREHELSRAAQTLELGQVRAGEMTRDLRWSQTARQGSVRVSGHRKPLFWLPARLRVRFDWLANQMPGRSFVASARVGHTALRGCEQPGDFPGVDGMLFKLPDPEQVLQAHQHPP
jgi:hypothetical protein